MNLEKRKKLYQYSGIGQLMWLVACLPGYHIFPTCLLDELSRPFIDRQEREWWYANSMIDQDGQRVGPWFKGEL